MRVRTGIVLGLLVTVTAAGCGGSGKDHGVATAGGTRTATARAGSGSGTEQDQTLKFAQCMRQHGIDVPDPKSGGGLDITLPKGTDPHKANAATQQCKQYLPGGGRPQKTSPEMVERQRKLAACMRANGVPKFPDPDANGSISIKGGPGLDPTSAGFKAAEKKCSKYRPGGGATTTDSGGSE
jgi:hypothetical protein